MPITSTLLRLNHLLTERRAASAAEYGVIGGVLALLIGLAFLHIAPHLTDAMARVVQSLSGSKSVD